MAMIICSECGAEISDQAVACPKCGVNLSSIVMIEKIKENKNHSCKSNLPNLIRECDELYKKRWYETFDMPLFLLSFGLVFIYGLGLLPLAIIFYLDYKKKKELKEALSRTMPCLKKIYPIVDASDITSKFDYIARNEKFTELERKREKLDYTIYSKAYKLGADAIIIDGQDTTAKVFSSVSVNRGKVKGETSTDTYDNVYVSYVKVKD
ncbi:MAG: zinc ribbon domain-containing protein [Sulfurimonas sp.]|jgi:hypothetical protein